MVVRSIGATKARCVVGASAGALALLLAGCATDTAGGGESVLPQSRFSIDDMPSADGAHEPRPARAPRQAAAEAPAATAERPNGTVAPVAVAPTPREPASSPLADARRLRQAGDKEKALALLDRVAEGSAGDPAVARERGLLALELGRLDKARPLLVQAAATAPGDWRVHSGLGVALAAEGKQQQAQMAFARALELAPDHPTVLNNLALSYALDGKHEQAEKLLKRAALAKVDKPQAKQNLALIQSLKGQAATKAAEARPTASTERSVLAGGKEALRRTALGTPDGPATVYRLGGPVD